MNKVNERFINKLNEVLTAYNSDWGVYNSDQQNYLMIFSDEDEIGTIPMLSSDHVTMATILMQCEKFSRKFFNKGLEIGRDQVKAELCDLIGAVQHIPKRSTPSSIPTVTIYE